MIVDIFAILIVALITVPPFALVVVLLRNGRKLRLLRKRADESSSNQPAERSTEMSKFKLSKELHGRVESLASDLQEAMDDLREDFYNRPEKWRDSDVGDSVDGWLDCLDNAIITLKNVSDEPLGQ